MSTDYDVVCIGCGDRHHLGQRFSSGWSFGYGTGDIKEQRACGEWMLSHFEHGAELVVVHSEFEPSTVHRIDREMNRLCAVAFDYARVAANNEENGRCPGCGFIGLWEQMAAHVGSCEHHPSAIYRRERDQLAAVNAELSAEAERLKAELEEERSLSRLRYSNAQANEARLHEALTRLCPEVDTFDGPSLREMEPNRAVQFFSTAGDIVNAVHALTVSDPTEWLRDVKLKVATAVRDVAVKRALITTNADYAKLSMNSIDITAIVDEVKP